MARAKTYGTTWWGRNWLASLTHIDNANRIPRGRSYANTGKVFDVNISPAEGRITAKVKGNYHPYYKVVLKFEQVNKEAKESFLGDLVKNITIVSKLTNRELDPSLLDLALKHHIKLFPSSWKDLGMTCNCPDFAVPCKHIAAVIYIVSEVIDSNPFYVFSLKGIDLLKELENRGFNLDEATRVETATFDLLSRNAITTIENLCAQAREFNMQLEPVIINRTVPLDWKPDFAQSSCYDVQAIIDVDAITSGALKDKGVSLSNATSDKTVISESAITSGAVPQDAESANGSSSKHKSKRKSHSKTVAPNAPDETLEQEDTSKESALNKVVAQTTILQHTSKLTPEVPQETSPKSHRGRKLKSEQVSLDKESTKETKAPLPLGAGVDKLCDTVGRIIESDFELSKRKKKPGRKSKEALEQEQHQAYLRAKFGSLTVGQVFESLNHNSEVEVFADGEDFAQVKLPESSQGERKALKKKSKASQGGDVKVAPKLNPAKRGRRTKS